MTLEERLREDEGEVLNLYYDDAGVPTIGVGCNLRDVRVPAELCKEITISKKGSAALFALRLADARAALEHYLPWALALDVPRQEVLVNMIFNMGVAGLMRRNPKMLAAAERGNYDEAAREMLDGPWKDQVGDRAHRLARQMESGERA